VPAEEIRPTLVEPIAMRRGRFARVAAPALALLAAVAAGSLTQSAHAGPPAPVVPAAIAVEDGHKPFLVGHAVGVQIYRCNAVGAGFGWGLLAPRAELYDDNGKLLMTHFQGPRWQAKDGSTVVGQRVDGVTVDPTAMQWLLLSAASATSGADGDRLAHTTFVQRIATTGGLAPAAAECNAGTAGVAHEVPYTADYVFWKAID
jgi:hypothetical protein